MSDGSAPRDPEADPDGGHALWGGRFEGGLDPTIAAFTNSLPFDRRLARHDLIGSLAHARMLGETGVLDEETTEQLLGGLSELLRAVEDGTLTVRGPDEDVHTWIQRTLGERIGGAAERLHTARSRNDQTATALRLWVREALLGTLDPLLELADAWLDAAGEHLETWMPGYTHLQRAQPVSLAHHLAAHAWALLADGRRLRAAHGAAGSCPLGAGALAGTSHPVDPDRTAALLGFRGVHPNSQLAVADRDWVAEAIFACALLMTHLSRWAEEVVLWTSAEFGFAELGDAVSQGSSLMPQKRNPEAAELIRGKCGRVVGGLTALLVTLKGLPLAYDSDLQEDKEPLFDALDTAAASLGAAAVLARGLRFRPDRMEEAARSGHLGATDLADLLVRRGVPFREAHRRAGAAVKEAEARGCELWELPPSRLHELLGTEPLDPDRDPGGLGTDLAALLTPEATVRARRSPGGPAPDRVREQLSRAREAAGALRSWREAAEPPPIYRAHREGRLTGEIRTGKGA